MPGRFGRIELAPTVMVRYTVPEPVPLPVHVLVPLLYETEQPLVFGVNDGVNVGVLLLIQPTDVVATC